ncbi:MAG: ATP-binding cassette domain-containing protein [Acidimicrobiales bacterium]
MSTLALRQVVAVVPATGRRVVVSAEVDSGELVAATDPTDGAASPEDGTALARTVAGLVEPVSGQVVIHGIDVTDRPPSDRGIRYVPAGGGLLPHLTVEQNVRYGLHRSPVVKEEGEWRVREAAERWDLTSVLGAHPHELSNEQWLQVAVARAVVCRPEALVADLSTVPTSPARLRDIFQRTEVAVLLCSGNPAAIDAAHHIVPVSVTAP